MDLVSAVEKRFARLSSEYKRWKSLAEKQVDLWHWATKEVWNLNPLYFEMNQERPGRSLAAKPTRLKEAFSYGTDSTGRVAVERQYTEVGPYERFFDWSKSPVEVAYFNPGNTPVNLQLARYSRDRLVQVATAAIYSATLETYEWDGPHLTRIEIRVADRTPDGLQKLADYQIVRATYDTDGAVKRVEIDWLPRPPHVRKRRTEVVFTRRDRPAMIDLRKDALDLRRMLEDAVRKYAARHADRTKRFPPVTRIDLTFSLGDSHSEPWISLCLDSQVGTKPGGGYTHADFATLTRKAWLPAVQTVCDGRKAELVTIEGERQKLNNSGLIRAIGSFLVASLLSAREDGVLAALPLADHCELGVEDPTTGAFGWPTYKDRGKENLAKPGRGPDRRSGRASRNSKSSTRRGR